MKISHSGPFKIVATQVSLCFFSLDTVERFDPEENSWTMMPSMTKVRNSFSFIKEFTFKYSIKVTLKIWI
jgi:hypothetical protein